MKASSNMSPTSPLLPLPAKILKKASEISDSEVEVRGLKPGPSPKPSNGILTGVPAEKAAIAKQTNARPTLSPKQAALSPLMLHLILFRKVLLLNDGRDKVLKVVQYVSKVLLWTNLLSKIGETKHTPPLQKALASIVPHLSLARKLVRLGNFLANIEALGTTTPALSKSYAFDFFNNVNAILNCIADDAYALTKIGMMKPDPFWSTWADRLWFIGIFFDTSEGFANLQKAQKNLESLYEKKRILILQMGAYVNGGSSAKAADFFGAPMSKDGSPSAAAILLQSNDIKIAELEKKIRLTQMTLVKLAADFVFCSFDVFNVVKRVKEVKGLRFRVTGPLVLATSDQLQKIQDIAGLASAILGTWKLYAQQTHK